MRGITLLEEIWAAFRQVSSVTLIDDVRHNEYLQDRFRQEGEWGQTFGGFIRGFYLPERWSAFEEAFFREAVVEEDKLVVFRCIEHPRPRDLLRRIVAGKGFGRKGHVGIFWSWASAAARCYWGDGTQPELHLTGLVPLSSIDVKMTVLANFHPEVGLDELEIRLLEGSPVTIAEGCFKPKSWGGHHEGLPCVSMNSVVRKA
jgi:hypothetical protein